VDHRRAEGGIGDNKITASINAGNPPDAVLSFGVDNVGKWCESGAWQDLNPYIQNEDPDVGIDMAATFRQGRSSTRASRASSARCRS